MKVFHWTVLESKVAIDTYDFNNIRSALWTLETMSILRPLVIAVVTVDEITVMPAIVPICHIEGKTAALQ